MSPKHKINELVLNKMKTKGSLLNTTKERKCQYFGHIIRRDNLQRLLMEGRINGRRGQGRPRTLWTDTIKEWTKIAHNDCIIVTKDRERWISMTAGPVDYRWHTVMMSVSPKWIRESPVMS